MPEQSFVARATVALPAQRRPADDAGRVDVVHRGDALDATPGAGVGAAGAGEPAPVRFRAIARPQGAAEVAAREEARAAGFAAGYAAGAREAARVAQDEARRVAAERAARQETESQALARALDALDRAARAAQDRVDPVLAQAEQRLHVAALELARAVLGSELSDHQHAARAALARVLEHPRLPDVVTVRLHPDDVAALRAVDALPQSPAVTVVADPGLCRGDAVAEHADGMLDARIGSALERARAVLEGERS